MNTYLSGVSKIFQKKSLLALTAVLSIASGFFVANVAFATHTASVVVDKTFVKVGSLTYTFTITNNGADTIDSIKITPPPSFTLNDTLVCPTGWNPVVTSSYSCLADPDVNEGLGNYVEVGSSVKISFSATSLTEGMHSWIVKTHDRQSIPDSVQTSNPTTTVDATAPVTSISSTDTAWHKGSVSITLTPSDIGGSNVASTHYQINVGGSWNVYTAPFEVSTQGDNTVSYYSIDGVENTEVTKKVESIKIDNIAPVTTLTIGEKKSGTNPVYVKSNTEISLSAIDDGSQGIVTTYSIDSTPATYSIPFTLSVPGTHTISYESVDSVGNVESTKTVSVFVDDLAPTVSPLVISPSFGSFISGLSDISAAVTDNGGSGVATCEYTLDGGANWILIAGGACSKTSVNTSSATSINIRATDKLGNMIIGTPVVVTPDFTAPVTKDSGTDENWHNTNVIVTLTPETDASGIAETKYKINGGEWNTYTAPFQVSTEGVNTISYYSVDKVGNVETAHATAFTVKIDKTAPTITDNNVSGWKNTATTVTLNPVDALSLIAGVKYCEGESCDLSVVGIDLVSLYTIPFTTDGVKTIRYQTADIAENLSAIGTFTVQTDTTVPTVSSITSVSPKQTTGGINYVRGTITIDASALDTVSGIAKVVFYHSSAEPVTIGEDATAPYSLSWDTHSVSDGPHHVFVIAYDQAGNVLESSHFPITVDNTVPLLLTNTLTGGFAMGENKMAFSPNADTKMDTVSINTSFSEEVVYSIKIKFGNTLTKDFGTLTATDPNSKIWNGEGNTGDGLYTVEITATDHAGNTFTDTSKTILLDKTAPTVEVGADIITATNKDVVALTSDSDSGIATYSWIGTGLTFSTASAKDTNISATIDGVYTATLTVTDNVGNSASDTLTFTKDTNKPTIIISSPVADAVYKTNENILSFTAGDTGTAITCSYQIGTGSTVSTPCTGNASLSGLVDGRNIVTVTVTDTAGNTVTSAPVSFVYDNNNTLTVGATGADFTTIQEAITKATGGDTVSIASGTYNESLLIEKKINLIGTGVTKAVISGLAPANYIVKINGTTANGSSFDNLEINGGTTNAFDYGIFVNNSGIASNPIEIKNSIVKNIWNTSANGIGTESSSYVLVHDNSISLFHKIGIRFINSGGKFYGNDVKGESVDGTTRVQNLVTLWGGSNVEIYNNTLHDAKSFGETQTWDSPAVFVSSNGGNGASYANIHNNEIYNGDTGIVIGSVYAVPPHTLGGTDTSTAEVSNNNLHDLNTAINFEVNTTSATIHGNKFVNNTKQLDTNDIVGPVTNAEANWWGASTGPAIGSVFANVDYRPWYLDETLTNLDETVPTVTLSSTVTSPTNVSPISIAIAFSESVTNFTAEDITVTNGTISDFTDSGFKVTPTLNGTITVSIAKDIAQDLSGNYNTASNVLSFAYDNVVPTATIAYSPETLTNQDVVATMTANEPVTVTSANGTTHTFTDNGSFSFTFVDAAGNTGSALAKVTNIDKTAPLEITLTGTPNTLTNSTATDITVGGTDVVAYQYKLDEGDYVNEKLVASHIIISALTDGTHTISVIGRDEAGNWKETPVTHSWTVETVRPTVVSKTPSVNAVGIDPNTNVVVTFSESVNVAPENIAVKKGETAIPVTVTFDSTGKIATIHASFVGNSTYEVKLLSTITDIAGNTLPELSWSFTTAVSYSIPLTKGWNLISLPVIPGNTAISSVLGTAKESIDTVWSYDAVNEKWYVYHANNSEISNLVSMTAGYGYWINYTDNVVGSLVGSGNLIQEGNSVPPSRKLKEGWNLIGYYQRPNTTSISAKNALYNNLNSVWTLLFGYDNTNKHITTLDSGSLLNQGEAFWVWLNGDRSYTMGNNDPE